MQAVADVHEMPFSRPPPVAVVLGVVWIDQLLPSQISANGPLGFDPTAVQAVVDVHETPRSWPPPVGVGVGWIDQRLPSQRSASVSEPPLMFV